MKKILALAFVAMMSIGAMAQTAQQVLDKTAAVIGNKGEKIECKRAFPKELNSQHLQNKSIGNMLNSQNRKIFVGGLPPATTKEIMIQFFRRYGEIEYCIVMTDKATDKPRGIFLFIISSQDFLTP